MYQVDFGKHGRAFSGHGHEMKIPGNLGIRHGGSHIPTSRVPVKYSQIPNGINYSTQIGK